MSTDVLAAPALGATLVALTEPLPGFPGHRNYALVAADRDGLVFWLQSIDPDGPRFLAVPAEPYFPDYRPVLPAPVREELALEGPAGEAPATPAIYCLVTVPGGDICAATANLRAPVVVNRATGRARQVVLADAGHPIRRPLRR